MEYQYKTITKNSVPRMNQNTVNNFKFADAVEVVKHSETAFTVSIFLDGNMSKVHGSKEMVIYKSEDLATRAIKRLRPDLKPTFRDMTLS